MGLELGGYGVHPGLRSYHHTTLKDAPASHEITTVYPESESIGTSDGRMRHQQQQQQQSLLK